MTVTLTEIPKNTEIVKAVCPACKKTVHAVGFMKGSRCDGITVVCKFCGRAYRIRAE